MLFSLKHWLSGNKEWIAALSGLAGFLAGPVVSFAKTIVGYLTDRSWSQKRTKNAQIVARCIRDLNEREKLPPYLNAEILNPYSRALAERLEAALQQLESADGRTAARECAKFEEPQGIRRGLLLFRPYGLTGWMLHSFFYGSVIAVAAFVVTVIHFAVDNVRNHVAVASDIAFVVILPAAYGAFALFPRSVALKRKKLSILQHRQPDVPDGASAIKRLLLAFPAPGRLAKFEKGIYYFCWMEMIVFPFAAKDMIGESPLTISVAVSLVFTFMVFALVAFLTGYDVYLRRRLMAFDNRGQVGTESAPPHERSGVVTIP